MQKRKTALENKVSKSKVLENEVSEVSPKKWAKDKIAIKQQSISPQKLHVSKKHTQLALDNSDTRQYNLEKINANEKNIFCTWHGSLINRPGVTGSMVNCLEIIACQVLN